MRGSLHSIGLGPCDRQRSQAAGGAQEPRPQPPTHRPARPARPPLPVRQDCYALCAAQPDVRVVSASYGGALGSRADRDAIAALCAAGKLLSAAAGNAGWDNDAEPMYPASYNLDCIVSGVCVRVACVLCRCFRVRIDAQVRCSWLLRVARSRRRSRHTSPLARCLVARPAVAATTPNDSLASFSNWGRTTVGEVPAKAVGASPGLERTVLAHAVFAEPSPQCPYAAVLSPHLPCLLPRPPQTWRPLESTSSARSTTPTMRTCGALQRRGWGGRTW